MRFSKMQGAGNDYVYVNCFTEPMPPNPTALAGPSAIGTSALAAMA